jgi:hypothetical protein
MFTGLIVFEPSDQRKMPSEPLHIFDPRRNLQLQGFAGRAATTIHDTMEVGVSILGDLVKYHQLLNKAMCFDVAKCPSVSWGATTSLWPF